MQLTFIIDNIRGTSESIIARTHLEYILTINTRACLSEEHHHLECDIYVLVAPYFVVYLLMLKLLFSQCFDTASKATGGCVN